jgi:hypothetical protein
MSKYSEEEKRRILRDARETLARLDDADRAAEIAAFAENPQPEDTERAWSPKPDILDPRQRSSAPMRKWREEALEAEARRAKAREACAQQEREKQMQRDADWNDWADTKIAAALEAHTFTDFQRDVIAHVIAQERKREARELEKALGEVVAKLREQLRKEFAAEIAKLRDDGKIVDLSKESWKRDVA